MSEWVQISEFPKYEISKLGQVRNIKTGRILKNWLDGRGYVSHGLVKDGKMYNRNLHRLLCIAFLPNPENKLAVNHIDGNMLNNTLENLEWCTYAENTKHALLTGLYKPHTKLTDSEVSQIRCLLKYGIRGADIADAYGVDKSHIHRIKVGTCR